MTGSQLRIQPCMSHLVLPILAALLMPQTPQQPPTPQMSRTLADMRDRYRPLLIFQDGKDERLREQLQLLTAHREDLLDRQIMLTIRPYAWAGMVDDDIMTFRDWSGEDALRHRFHIHPRDFTVILLGKDGTEKFRSHTLVTIDQLTRLIDTMPMRQQELSTRKPSAKRSQ